MKLTLRDRNQNVVDAWKIAFQGVPDVEISCGDLFDIKADVVIAPSNGFYFMTGGIDAVIEQKLHVQNRLREFLSDDIDEILVGEAILASTETEDYMYVASAPTMRIPMNIEGTVNVYLAFKAALKEILGQNEFNQDMDEEMALTTNGEKVKTPLITSILCPGMGTGVGKMDPMIAAFQMREAYDQIMMGQTRFFKELSEAYRFHISMAKGIIPPRQKSEDDEIVAKFNQNLDVQYNN